MKPLRCHHCRRCNRCVMKMDHHCYWINNCVGFRNIKYFILTLFYGSLGSVYMLFAFIGRWWWLLIRKVDMPYVEVAVLFVATVLLCAHGATIVYLLGFHTFLLSRDRTSVEHRCCKGKKPGCNHDKGLRRNLEETFGPLSSLPFYFLPIRTPAIFETDRATSRRLSNLYRRHDLARPYFDDVYGDATMVTEDTPLRSGGLSAVI